MKRIRLTIVGGVLALVTTSAQAQFVGAAAPAPTPAASRGPVEVGALFYYLNGPVYQRGYFSTSPTKSPVEVYRQYDPTGRNSRLAKPWLKPLR